MARTHAETSITLDARFRSAVLDQSRVTGLTHTFYRYPARFSPSFARACIERFSRPGDTVLDPYMGGGTTVVEAMVHGRRAIGSDLNELAVFVTRVKATPLSGRERRAVICWCDEVIPEINCRMQSPVQSRTPRNMHLDQVRWLKKLLALIQQSIDEQLPTAKSKRFARCALLNTGQWALNGRRQVPSVSEFRERLALVIHEMLAGLVSLNEAMPDAVHKPILVHADVESLESKLTRVDAPRADLVVTSPPYPGVHILYHRWQVDGRKETDAPYWISGTNDGQGCSFYNFADRRRNAEDRYYEKAERAFRSVRSAMRKGAVLAQLVAFTEPTRQLPRYIRMLERSGFAETREPGTHRIWRPVPGRSWHASSKGRLNTSREVMLLHEAV